MPKSSLEDINIRLATEEVNLQETPKCVVKINLEKIEQEDTENFSCRICQSEESTKDNPLISPCKCTGSIKYIHIKCMQEWYKSKMIVRVQLNTSFYLIRGLECELCKQPYSMNILHEGAKFDLVNIIRPTDEPYIVLESIGASNETQIHVAGIGKENTIKIVGMYN